MTPWRDRLHETKEGMSEEDGESEEWDSSDESEADQEPDDEIVTALDSQSGAEAPDVIDTGIFEKKF